MIDKPIKDAAGARDLMIESVSEIADKWMPYALERIKDAAGKGDCTVIINQDGPTTCNGIRPITKPMEKEFERRLTAIGFCAWSCPVGGTHGHDRSIAISWSNG